jgi:hypothetical protein
LKPLLAATALHYGGLVPMHITYDEPNQCAAQVIRCGRVGMQCALHIVLTSPHRILMQDWLWSVGDSPLAHTSQHHRFSLLQRVRPRRGVNGLTFI